MGQSGTQSVTVNPFGFQSGTMVVISGGQLSISGVIVKTSGEYFNVAASGVGISHYSGALNVNISGGTISANVSGNYVNVASSGVPITHYSGALNINISGGTISTTPPAYQSGTLVGISGGQLGLSGLIVKISGEYLNLASSGVGISHFSGALNVNISGGTISANVSGNYVNLASSGVGISHYSGALNVNISGAGTLTVSLAGTQVSGTVAVSGQVIITSGGIIPISQVSGGFNVSGGFTVSGSLQISGTVAVSGQVIITSGGVIPVGVVSGIQPIHNTYTLMFSGFVTVSGSASSGFTRGVIGFYNPGPNIIDIVEYDWAGLTVNNQRMAITRVSGIISGGVAQNPFPNDTTNTTTTVSGWVMSGVSTTISIASGLFG
ncbi:MAG: hypothetical protein AABY22_10225, partial [Nanoarchaeota archaeon]